MPFRGPSIAFAAAFVAAMSGAQARATELLTNGGFETGSFSGWTVGGNPQSDGVVVNYSYLGSYYGGATYSVVHSGSYSAEYVGNSSNIFTLTQSITAGAGLLTLSGYIGSYDASYPSGYGGGATIYIDGTALSLSANSSAPSNGTMSLFQGSTTVTAGVHTVEYSFQYSGGATNGFSIDDLSANGAVAAPEPASLGLMLAGLGSLGFLRRRAARAL
jgi:hypothetical protein